MAYEVWPRVGSLVPGPMEPSTQRGRPSVAKSSATSRASRAPDSDSSWIRSAMSYSLAALWLAPKVLVSTQSTPTAKYASWTERTMSGRVMLRISLQPSSCWKSSRVGFCAWSIVPMAPSATTTREASASRRAVARAACADGAPDDGAPDAETEYERDGEAMEVLPGVRRLSAMRRLPRGVQGAPSQGSRRSPSASKPFRRADGWCHTRLCDDDGRQCRPGRGKARSFRTPARRLWSAC